MPELRIIEVSALPKLFSNKDFISAMLGSQFLICHDLERSRTFMATCNSDGIMRLGRLVTGISFREADSRTIELRNPLYIEGYCPGREERKGVQVEETFSDLYLLFGNTNMRFMVSFVPSGPGEIGSVKRRVERLASSRSVRMTRMMGSRQAASSSESVQMDLYYGSDERLILLELLEMLNKAALNNGISYKVGFVIDGDYGKCGFLDYLMSKILVFDKSAVNERNLDGIFGFLGSADAIPLSCEHAARLLQFSNRITREEMIPTAFSGSVGDIELGEFLEGANTGRGETVRLDTRIFNLGTIISGMPGSGKTATAMGLLNQLAVRSGANAVMISPTKEWNGLGRELGMRIIRIYDDQTRINFFKCDSGINIGRFYENLAMLIASASNAGPYRNSLEKSLLAAFHKAYGRTTAPDPAAVYDEIENAVIEQHGKKNSVEVTFTKHGENIMAALEDLRLMLLRPQFAYAEGIDFNDLLKAGVVFDLSQVSNNMKPFFYALILNQVYSLADALDENGNDKLRMMMCLEEAQLVFDNTEESAASMDLKQRIQDFRKKGVGLFMITHNITDIDIGIRRLCQIKLYFRQSSDVTKFACNDLIFPEDQKEQIIDKLKRLPQGVCALSYMALDGNLRVPKQSIFVKLYKHDINAGEEGGGDRQATANAVALCGTMSITLLDAEGMPRPDVRIEVCYLGETLHRMPTDKAGKAVVNDTLMGKLYKLRVLGDRKRETRTFTVIGGRENTVRT